MFTLTHTEIWWKAHLSANRTYADSTWILLEKEL